MSARPRLTILSPSFNHAAFVRECVASVQAQEFSDWEMLLLDDGSSDGTPDLAEAIGEERLRVVRLPHRGLAALGETYRQGAMLARGEWLAILEADDLWPPEKLQIQAPDMDDADLALSAGRFWIRREGQADVLAPPELPPEPLASNEPLGSVARLMLDPKWLTFTFPVTVLMRASALMASGGFLQPEGLPLVDYPTFLRTCLHGSWRFHPEPLGIWRRHEASTTLSKWPEILEGCYRFASEYSGRRFRNLPIDPAEWERLERAWEFFQVNRLVAMGRALARERRFEAAKSAFGRAREFSLGPRDRVALPMASLLCAARLSPDFAFRLVGTAGARQGRAEAAGDWLFRTDQDPQEFRRWPLGPSASVEAKPKASPPRD